MKILTLLRKFLARPSPLLTFLWEKHVLTLILQPPGFKAAQGSTLLQLKPSPS